MICRLDELFDLLGENGPVIPAKQQPCGGLFDIPGDPPSTGGENYSCPPWLFGLFAEGGITLTALPRHACRLFELSANAFDAVVHAWMSEMPIDAEIVRFGRKVLASSQRQAAERAAGDRGDDDVCAVQEAALKVWHETHRLMGLLRFKPAEDGVYIAHCEPDYFTLPALAEHFTRRFGDKSWAIIDERRSLCLWRMADEQARLSPADTAPIGTAVQSTEWDKLWRLYHTTINNESRNNPGLQRQFMPKRYWKYLPEMQ